MMISLISGALVMGYFVAGLFFLRFWKETADRLFGIFGFAFLLLGAQRVALVFVVFEGDSATWLYAVRLLAFLLMLYAIYDKNRVPAR
jgi:hypothetical protein